MMNVETPLDLSKLPPAEAHRMVADRLGAEGHKTFFEHRGRQECIRQAMAKPLPGASGDAFTAGDMKVNGRKIYPVVPTHFRVLQAVESPLLKLLAGAVEKAGESASMEIEESAEWEICYIFTAPPRELRKQLKEQGMASIKASAQTLCDGEKPWTAAEINATVLAAVAQLNEHVKTTVAFEAEAEATSNSSFFQMLRENNSKPPASEK